MLCKLIKYLYLESWNKLNQTNLKSKIFFLLGNKEKPQKLKCNMSQIISSCNLEYFPFSAYYEPLPALSILIIAAWDNIAVYEEPLLVHFGGRNSFCHTPALCSGWQYWRPFYHILFYHILMTILEYFQRMTILEVATTLFITAVHLPLPTRWQYWDSWKTKYT